MDPPQFRACPKSISVTAINSRSLLGWKFRVKDASRVLLILIQPNQQQKLKCLLLDLFLYVPLTKTQHLQLIRLCPDCFPFPSLDAEGYRVDRLFFCRLNDQVRTSCFPSHCRKKRLLDCRNTTKPGFHLLLITAIGRIGSPISS